jgi:hypothetical protein
MRTGQPAAAVAILVLSLLALSSCGGGDEDSTAAAQRSETSSASALPPRRVIAAADRNCEQMLREVNRVGREAKRAGYEKAAELTRKGFAEPGLKIFQELARHQQRLQAQADSAAFSRYAASFDPIIVLGEQWLQAQRANQFEQVMRLQELLTNLGLEQQQLARRAGLPNCSLDFLNAMVRSATS